MARHIRPRLGVPLGCAHGCVAASCFLAVAAAWAQASDGPLTLPPSNVTGYAAPVEKSALSSDPAANPASVTVLEFTDERRRNTRDYVDLLKPVMGVAANNFDQGGIGFGFTMRGFSERSNGGGVAYSIDGVPVNLPSHPLTNGYGDLAESEIYNTVRRVIGATTENTDFRILNPFLYAQANYKPLAALKLTGGLRYDRLTFDIDDQQRNISVSPEVGSPRPAS